MVPRLRGDDVIHKYDSIHGDGVIGGDDVTCIELSLKTSHWPNLTTEGCLALSGLFSTVYSIF